MKRDLLAIGVTACIVVSLVAFAQPSAAVLATVSGPDEVEKPDELTVSTAIEIGEDERIPIEGIDLVIATEDGATVTVSLEPDGTVRSVDPPRGVVGEGEIRVNRLAKTIDVTRTGEAGYGYGYLSGEDERTGERDSFGYGYGYGYADSDAPFGFEIELDSRAFKQGVYELRVDVDAGDRTFSSDTTTVEVQLPTGNQPGEPSDDRPGDRDADRADDDHPGDRNRGADRGNQRGGNAAPDAVTARR